jgi:signal transduction histidine kinase
MQPVSGGAWLWTWGVAGVAGVVAVGVLVASVILSRQVRQVVERPVGELTSDAFRQVSRRVVELEGLWERALDEAAAELLEKGGRAEAGSLRVVGVDQWALFSARGIADTTKHGRPDGGVVGLRPVLKRFARGVEEEWVVDDAAIFEGSGWLEMPGRPLAWWRGNGHSAVLLIVDPLAASEVVEADLRGRFDGKALAGEGGGSIWSSPRGTPWLEAGSRSQAAAPGEIFRHVSRFGDWTVARIFPVREEAVWRVPVLLAGCFLALLLIIAGTAAAWMQRRAMRHASARVSFVNCVSHELRTPLTNLLLNMDLAMEQRDASPKMMRRLGLMREETGRLVRIVDNVLSFARLERGGTSHGARCELRDVVAPVLQTFTPLFARKSIRCVMEDRTEGGIEVDGDVVSQILANLLSNVEKHAGESAVATLAIYREDGNVVMEVRDDGPGIPTEARRRVFEPFERGSSALTEGASGTGLGLAISRGLAVSVGGSLELVPAPRGAHFRLVLPLEERRVA